MASAADMPSSICTCNAIAPCELRFVSILEPPNPNLVAVPNPIPALRESDRLGAAALRESDRAARRESDRFGSDRLGVALTRESDRFGAAALRESELFSSERLAAADRRRMAPLCPAALLREYDSLRVAPLCESDGLRVAPLRESDDDAGTSSTPDFRRTMC